MLQNYLYLKPTSCYNMTDTNQRDTEKIMQLRYEIPDTFWSLFRSVNREIYMESLLVINEEYQYSNYFLTKEICVQVLSDMNAQKQVLLQREENETDFDLIDAHIWELKSLEVRYDKAIRQAKTGLQNACG